jgi:hypothetical protein
MSSSRNRTLTLGAFGKPKARVTGRPLFRRKHPAPPPPPAGEGGFNISDALINFARPVIDQAGNNRTALRGAMNVAILVWNALIDDAPALAAVKEKPADADATGNAADAAAPADTAPPTAPTAPTAATAPAASAAVSPLTPAIDDAKKKLAALPGATPEQIDELFDALAARKAELYPDVKQRIRDYTLNFTKRGARISVASINFTPPGVEKTDVAVRLGAVK